ncbi:MAG: hypothetical protein V4577_04895 [Bacteroidota bacterium]
MVFENATLQQNANSIVNNNIVGWFNYLKNTKCRKLKLRYHHSISQSQSKDHETAGFVGGGGTWLIEAVYDSHSTYWIGKEDLTHKDKKDGKIWNITYSQLLSKPDAFQPNYSLVEAKQKLASILTRIAAFADKHNMDYWADIFQKAKKNLTITQPVVDYYKDFIVIENYSLSARQVLFAASTAWVFGGMGSWNDILYENEKDNSLNNALSSELYDAVIEGTIAAVNSFPGNNS